MVAIIGGNGLGLSESSLAALGRFGAGQTGSASQGQARERIYVDAATGNLVVQGTDGLLAGLGPDVASLRTYNSQGGANFTNNDGWMKGQYKSVVNLGGGVLRRTEADGSTTDYLWKAETQTYVESYSPSGAVDTIKDNGNGTFTWTSGSTGATETYQSSGLGLITQAKDTSGNTLTFIYTGNLLTEVRTANGESVAYTYTGTDLTQMVTKGTSGQVLSKVEYAYDTSHRLTSVKVTLNPLGRSEVASAETLAVYTTTYTYDGTSKRVASITQSDGTKVSFTYVNVNGADRIATVTDGNGAITQFGYNTTTNTTTITDPYGVSSVYVYDSKGQLTQIRTGVTAANSAGLTQVGYTYNDKGEVTSITDGTGRITTMVYDSKGNLLSQVDGGRNTRAWTYNGSNQVLTDTAYAVPAAVGAAASATQITRYVYASANATQLRYVIGADGAVTEYRYNAQGLRSRTLLYTSGVYLINDLLVPTESEMQIWAANQDPGMIQRTDYTYDFRGQLQSSTIGATGHGNESTATTFEGEQAVRIWHKEGTNPALVRNLGIFQAGDTVTASVRYKAEAGVEAHLYLGGSGSNYAEQSVIGDGQWHTMTVTRTMSQADTISVLIYGNVWGTDPANATSVIYDDVRVTSTQKGLVFLDGFENGLGNWNSGGQPNDLLTASTASTYSGNQSVRIWHKEGTNPALVRNVGTFQAGDIVTASVRYKAEAGVEAHLYLGGTGSNYAEQSVIGDGQWHTMTVTRTMSQADTISVLIYGNVWGTDPANATSVIYDDVRVASTQKGVVFQDGFENGLGNWSSGGQPNDLLTASTASTYSGNQSVRIWHKEGTNPALVRNVGTFQAGDIVTASVRYKAEAGVEAHLYLGGSGSNYAEKSVIGDGQWHTMTVTRTMSQTDTISVLIYGNVWGSDPTNATSVIYDDVRVASTQKGVVFLDGFENGIGSWYSSGQPNDLLKAVGKGTTQPATTQYIYDAHGNLLQTITPDGQGITHSIYDGLGRVVSSMSKSADGGLSTTTITQYDDAQGKVSVTLANGLSTASTFDKAGRLVSVVQLSGSSSLGTTAYEYDKDGRLLMTTDPTGARAWAIYDAAGRKVGDIDGAGGLTEYVYNAANQVTQTIRYANAVNVALLVDGNGKATTSLSGGGNLDSLRPVANAEDVKSWNLYDEAGRLAWQVDGQGYVTETKYDGANRVVSVTRLDTPVDVSKLGKGAEWIPLKGWTEGNSAVLKVPAGGWIGKYQSVACKPGDVFQVEAFARTLGMTTGNAYVGIRFDSDTQTGIGWAGPSFDGAPVAVSNGTRTRLACTGTAPAGATKALLYIECGSCNEGAIASYDSVTMSKGGSVAGVVSAQSNLWPSEMNQALTVPAGGWVGKYNYIACAPGDVIYGEALANALGMTAGNAHIGIRFDSDTQTGIGWATLRSDGGPLLTASATWSRIACMGTAPAGTTKALIYVECGTCNQGSVGQFNAITFSKGSPLSTQAGPSDRVATSLYSDEGLLRGVVDGEGYLTEFRYDGSRRQVQSIAHKSVRYADAADRNALSMAARSKGPGQALVDTADPEAIQTFTYYNGRGQVIGEVDGEGYLTEYMYNAAGQETQRIRYSNKVKVAASTGSTLTDLRNPDALKDQVTATTYDALGRVLTQTNPEDTVTKYAYDTLGRVVSTTTALNTEDQRVGLVQYDVQSRVTAELSGEGASRLVSGMTQAQIDAVWNQYGIRHAYDAAGRRISSTDGLEQKTVFFYDDAGRLTHTVNAKGEVSETEYDALGRIKATVQYADRIAGDSSVGLAGGLLSATVNQSAVSALQTAKYGTMASTFNTFKGKQAVRLWHVAGGGSAIHRYLGTFKAGDTVVATGWFKAPAGKHGDMFLGDAGGPDAYDNHTGRAIEATGEWQKITLTHTLTHDDDMWVYIYGNQWTPSGSASGNDVSVIWDDIHVSSTQRGVVLSEGFENGITWGSSYIDPNGWGSWGQPTETLTSSTETTYSGEKSVRLWHVAGGGSAIHRYLGTFKAGDTVVATGWFKAPAGKHGDMFLGDAAGPDAYDNHTGRAIEATGEWQKITLTHTMTHDDDMWVYIYGNQWTPSGSASGNDVSVIWDDIRVSSTQRGVVLSEGFENGITWASSYTDLNGWGSWGQPTEVLPTARGLSTLNTYVSYDYNASGRLWKTTDALGGVTERTYNAFGETRTVSERLSATQSRIITNAYDRRGLLTGTMSDPGWGASSLTTSSEYDAFGRLVARVDGNGSRSTFTYDRLGRMVTAVDPNQKSRFTSYDAFGRVFEEKDARGNTTRYAYSVSDRSVTVTTAEGVSVTTQRTRQGQTLSVKDGNGTVTSYAYNKDGRLTSTRRTVSGVVEEIANEYDALGRLFRAKDGNGNIVEYAYDAANRLLTRTVDPGGLGLRTLYEYTAKGQTWRVTDAAGAVTETSYDAKGQVLTQTVDPGGLGIQTVYSYDQAGNVLTVTSGKTATSPGGTTRYAYDNLGRRIYTLNGEGGLTRFKYDGNGNLVERLAFSNRVTVGSWTPGVEPTQDAARDQRVRTVYDKLNRAAYTLSSTGNGSVVSVVSHTYDENGNEVGRRAYAATVAAPAATATAAQLDAAAKAVVAGSTDAVVRRVFDKDNRLIWSVDGTGSVKRQVFDNNGNLVKLVVYKNTVSAAADPSTVVKVPGEDRVTQMAYDQAGRLRFTVDALGGVTETVYDRAGNAVKRIAYAKLVAAPTESSAALDAGTFVPAKDSVNDRITREVYDAAGRQVYSIDASKAVVKRSFDGNGRIIGTTAYAKQMTDAAWTALPTVAQPGNLNPEVSSDDRTAVNAYDAAGRLAYRVDAKGYVTGNEYDGLGRVVKTVQYANAVSGVAAGTSVEGIKIKLPGSPNLSVDRVNTFGYDAAGNLVSSTDALQKTESYTYDGLGNKKTFTNKNNPAATWTYVYDAMGRLIEERAPQVDVTSAVWNSTAGKLEEGSTSPVSLVTRLEYDGLGNLLSRTEACGTSTERKTSYHYDALGHQVRIIYPAVTVYNRSDVASLASGGAGESARSESLRTLETKVFYNTFGEAVVNIDVAGNASSKVYDKVGRVVYDVDAMGHVTEYGRNRFGEVLDLTRYGIQTSLNASAGQGASGAPTLGAVASAKAVAGFMNDRRTITTQYDVLGRAIRVQEPVASVNDGMEGANYDCAPVTRTEYNAFGEVSKRSVLAKAPNGEVGAGAVWAETRSYYDQRGSLAAVVDPMGYVTRMTYDAVGNLESRTEYAKASPGWTVTSANPGAEPGSPDRTTRYEYDVMNRLKKEIQVDVAFSETGEAAVVTKDLVTAVYEYDAVGNQTVATDAKGLRTITSYDALGRITSVQSPETAGGLTPVTEFKRDAFGNVVIRVDKAVSGASANRTTFTSCDLMGHAKTVTDALGINHFMSYDEAGRLAKVWQGVKDLNGAESTLYTAFTYDALGRQIEVITPATTSMLSATVTGDNLHDLSTVTTRGQSQAGSQVDGMRHNGYGEVTGQGSYAYGAAPDYQQTFEYDGAGRMWRMWRTRGKDGNFTVYLHDVQGRQVSSITSAGSVGGTGMGTDLGASASSSAVAALSPTANLVRRTDSQLDLLGRAVKQKLPARLNNASVVERPYVDQTFDRWGNVLTQSDVRNGAWITKYTYDFRNKVMSQLQPDIDGVTSTANAGCPLTEMYYDAMGNQVAVKGARGYVNKQVWDAAGHVVKEIHADGGEVNHTYNEFGERIQITDAEGGVTKYLYDKLGRNTDIIHVEMDVYATASNGLSASLVGTQDLTTKMQYDEAGRKLKETNPALESTSYVYDLRGNVLETKNALNRTTKKAVFDRQDRQTAELDALGSLNTWTYDSMSGKLTGHAWSYVEVTQEYVGERISGYKSSYDPNTQMWTQIPIYESFYRDVYNKATSTDAFDYDNAKQLMKQTTVLSDGQKLSRAYGYDAAGQLVKIEDVSTTASNVSTTKLTTYTYNAAGQHLNETVKQGGTTIQSQNLGYDTLGRLWHIDNQDGLVIDYTYDKEGNLRKTEITREVIDKIAVPSGSTSPSGGPSGPSGGDSGPGLPPGPDPDPGDGSTTTTIKDRRRVMKQILHSAYDKMNRQIMADGVSVVDESITDPNHITHDHLAANGGVTVKTWIDGVEGAVQSSTTPQGHILYYDKNGNRTIDKTIGTQVVPVWNLQNWAGMTYTTKTGVITTYYSYDAMDRLSSVAIGGFDIWGNPDLNQDHAIVLDTRRYDGASRMVSQGPLISLPANYVTALNGSDLDKSGATSTVNRYDAAGQLTSQHVDNHATATSYDAKYWYDAAGNMSHYQIDNSSGSQWYSSNLTRVYGGYKEASLTGTISANGGYSSGTTTKTYDAAGMLVGVVDSKDSANNRTLVNDAFGHVLQKTQGFSVSKEVVANGEAVGRYSSAISATDSLWNFDLGFAPVTNSYPAAATGNYPVQSGDTLEGIAQAAYGDSSLWYVIAEANGLSGTQDLRVGQILTIPNRVGGVHNTSETRTPYDPSKIIGNTSPTIPAPPPPSNNNGCGGFGQFIMIVVAVVVTYYTAGLASSWLSTAAPSMFATGAAGTAAANAVVAGAISGAAGSIASQGVGIAIGAQDGFDWGQVGMGALSGAVGGAINGINVNGATVGGIKSGTLSVTNTGGWGGYVSTMGRAALTSAATQGIAVAVGLQDKFSWTSVAASAVGAGVGKAVGGGMSKALDGKQGWSPFAKGLTSGTVSGFAAGMATSVMHGGKIDIIRVATDAFGNALGSSLGEAMEPKSHLAELMAKARADIRPVDINWNLPPETLVPGGALSQADYDKGLESLVTILHNQAAAGSLPANVAYPQGKWVEGGDTIIGLTGSDDLAMIGAAKRINGLKGEYLPQGSFFISPTEADIRSGDREIGLGQYKADIGRQYMKSLPSPIRSDFQDQFVNWLDNAPEPISDSLNAKFGPALDQINADKAGLQQFIAQAKASQAYTNSFPSGGTDWTDINNIRNSWVGDTAFRTMGLARAGGGGLMAFGASTLDLTGFGAVIGVPAAVWGLSQVGPGLSEFWNGPNGGHVQTVQTQAMIGLGVTPWKAEFADNLAGMALGFGAAVSPQWQPRIAPNTEGLAPRLDLSGQFSQVRAGRGVTAIYEYGDPEFHGIRMTVNKDGILGTQVAAYGDRATLGTGTDMMLSGINRLKADGVQINGIRGFWSEGFGSTNLDAYWNNISAGMSPQNAAMNTWTGRLSTRLGYTNVSIPQTPLGMPPQPGVPVVTIFKKP